MHRKTQHGQYPPAISWKICSTLCSLLRWAVYGFWSKTPLVIEMSEVWSIYHHRTKKPVCWTVSVLADQDQRSKQPIYNHWPLTNPRGGGVRMSFFMKEVERVAKCSRPLSAPSEQMGIFGMKGRWVTHKPMQNLSAGTPGLIGAPPKSGKMLSSSGTSSAALNYSGHCRA